MPETDVPRPTQPNETKTTAEDDVWKTELLEFRAKKDEDLKSSETSPMAGLQYLKADRRESIYLTLKEGIFGLEYVPVPDAVLFVVKQVDRWYWHDQGHNVVCRKDEQILPNGAPLPTSALFDVEGFVVSSFRRGDDVTFIVFDPERPEMKHFEYLHYFPPDRKYAVSARLVPTEENDEVKMLTSQNLEKIFYRYAKILFQVDGEEHELTAFKYALTGDNSSTLFIPFKDATSARETYGAGRFLEIEEPEEENFVLDFNRCFNPLCNYSPAYNCPYPPKENHLTIAIRAGEMTYPH